MIEHSPGGVHSQAHVHHEPHHGHGNNKYKDKSHAFENNEYRRYQGNEADVAV
jgi:hypothetical protein